MSRNIKEIGKELMGKSLNSFHRKTGLTQLEKNNEMQDGILNGILSQVDDAYIEKTEQSNVIHLDGSGDGVVLVDSIEGNTMVNLLGSALDDTSYYTKNSNNSINIIKHDTTLPPFKNENHRNLNLLKPNTKYTLIVNGDYTKVHAILRDYKIEGGTSKEVIEIMNSPLSSNKTVFTTYHNKTYIKLISSQGDSASNYPINNLFVSILEGDWTNKEIPSYFEGLQSSFEDKVNDEGKYEIEILSKTSKNLYDLKTVNHDWTGGTMDIIISPNDLNYHSCEPFDISHLRGKTIYTGMFRDGVLRNNGIQFVIVFDENRNKIGERFNITSQGYLVPNNAKYMRLMQNCGGNSKSWIDRDKYVVKLEPFTSGEKLVKHKSNKIKLLINEPLRSTKLAKDRLCVVDGKLMVERKNKQIIINGEEKYKQSNLGEVVNCAYFEILDIVDALKRTQNGEVYCDKLPSLGELDKLQDKENIFCDPNYNLIGIKISRSKLTTHDIDGIKTYFRNNNTKLCYPLKEPYYEEVTNEYGEPILLEGYENGTLYIDSTIIPTISVRYTPKMESLNTLKEVNNNNVMLTNDINDTIIPYMMDVDLMIMEKEMALPSQINIRKMEVLDMTSMQKRTQDMLERLIKGKTLTEQECKTRVVTYLNAGKITDAQAEELMLLIDEVYA